MNKTYLLLLTAATLFVSFAAKAQVTIGGNSDPVAGAVLDLNSTNKGGLLLSSISITNLSKIPAGLVGIAAEQDTNPDLVGMIVYNTNATTGLGMYVWDGDAWVKLSKPQEADPICGQIKNVVAYAKGPVILPTGGSVEIGVLSDGSNLTVAGTIRKTYRWQRTGANNTTWMDLGSAPGDYTIDSRTISFPQSGGEGTYYVRVKAENCFNALSSPAAPAVLSNQIKVIVVNNPANLANSNYRITGVDCYDVVRTGDKRARPDVFAGGAFTKPYKFVFGGAYTDLQVFVLSDSAGLVSGLSSPPPNGTGTGTADFNLVFKSTVSNLVGDKGKKTVRIGASYKDNTGADKLAYMEIKVQDADCACSVAYRTSQSGNITGWKRFQCYNLGADSSLTIDQMKAVSNNTPTNSNQNIIYTTEAAAANYTKVNGGSFQWGRKADGHQQVWSAVTSGKVAAANWNNAGPNFRNISNDVPNDWLDGSNTKPGRWGGDATGDIKNSDKGPNDPCPPGWKIPTLNDWQVILNGAGNFTGITALPYNGVNRWVWVDANNSTAGILIYPPKAGVSEPKSTADYETTPRLFLPAAGYRSGVMNSSPIYLLGTGGRYQSTQLPNENTVYTFYFSNQNIRVESNGMYRAHGFSVRCVAE